MATYSISLDDVDLALLPMRPHTHNNFLKKEYFQFQIMKEETVQETTISSSATYTCHICAIEVPAAFASEHAASVKHRANARIASEAVRRTRELIAALPPPLARLPNARFCAHCVRVVDGDHEKTKEHRVAVMHDSLLWELLKAYVGDDAEHFDDKKSRVRSSIDDRKDEEIKNVVPQAPKNNITTIQTVENTDNKCVQDGQIAESSNINNRTLENIIGKETNKEETSTNTNKNESIPNGNVPHSTSRWVKVPTVKEVENRMIQNGPANVVATYAKTKHSKEDYEKELSKFMDNDHPFEIKEAYYNRIQLKVNDVTMNVYSDHFHSYHRMFNNGKIECILCDCTFNNKDAEAHKYDLRHMAGVAKIGKNCDFMREINETYSHCILCNQKIRNENLSIHKQSQYHVIRKTNHIKTNTTKPKISEATKTEKRDETENVNDKKTNVKSAVETKSNNVGSQIEYPYEDVPGKYDVRCLICNCDVPRNIRNREDHAKGSRHISNMK